MDYIPPLNAPATLDNPRPSYFDGNKQTGQEGSYPSGKSLENPMREILAVIEAAGLTPTNTDLTQLLQAINALITAGGGGGGGGDPVDFTLNPVFPHVTVGGGIMSVSSSSGQVQLASGQTFVHRGGVLYNTTDIDVGDRTKTTTALKTYHLRWRYNGGTPVIVLADLVDSGYNPGALAETNAAFDTSFDDMLIARVVTDAANTPTVTALKNLNRLAHSEILGGTSGVNVGNNGANWLFSKTLNWARSPDQRMIAVAKAIGQDGDRDRNIFAANLSRSTAELANGQAPTFPLTRYGLDCAILNDEADELHVHFMAGA